jgi:hypothetical protein
MFSNFKQFIDRAQKAQHAADAAVGRDSKLHQIDVQLTDNEYNAMTLLCAFATEAAFRNGDRKLANMFIAVTNRLHENDLGFVPYDEKTIRGISVQKKP